VGSSFAKVVAFTIVSDPEYALVRSCPAGDLACVGDSTEWITGWPGWIEAITVFKLGERMTIGQQGRTAVTASRPTTS
jgi:hypothetical protein